LTPSQARAGLPMLQQSHSFNEKVKFDMLPETFKCL
jgi:hypothetical protein